MRKVSSCILSLICSFLLFLAFPATIGAQNLLPGTQKGSEEGVSEVQEDSVQAPELRLSEIIKQSNTDAKTLETLRSGLNDTTQYRKLQRQYADYLKAYEAFKVDKLNKNLPALTYRELNSLITVLRYKGKDIEATTEDYEKVIDQFDEERLLISEMALYWEDYTENNNGVPPFKNEIQISRIGEILEDSRSLSGLYESRIEEMLINLTQLTKIQSEIDDEITIDTALLSELNSVFDKNRESYIQGFRNFSFPKIISEILLYGDMVSYDLENAYTNLVSKHLFVFCIFLLILFMCMRTRKQLKTQEPDLNSTFPNVKKVFEMPFTTAIFLTFLFSSLTYLQAPPIINNISGLVIVGILYLISRKIFEESFLKVIRVFIYCWLAIKVVEVLSFESLPGRSLLLLLNIFFVYLIVQINRKQSILINFQKNALSKIFFRYYVLVVVLVMGISLISNILGYLNISMSITSLTIKLSLLALYLYLWNPIFKAFIALGLQGNYLSSKLSVSQNKVSIQKFLYRVIDLSTYVVFAYSALSILTFIAPLLSGIWEVLNSPISLGSIEFTLWNLILFVIILWASSLISRIVQSLLRHEVLARADLDRGLPATISMLVRYAIITIGFFIAVTSLGFEMNQLTIIFGAFSVGIGFGLQNIFNNLVSGIILIFERPIHIDDTIEVNNMIGNVSNIGIRSSNIRTVDGAEVIVPNGQLISKEVINWTLSDQNRRIEVLVGVAYGSDVHKVAELLNGILLSSPRVLKQPEPGVFFQEFADSSLNFRLLFWTDSNKDWIRIKSDILFEINDVFAREGIEIPFPQRDIHLRTWNKKEE